MEPGIPESSAQSPPLAPTDSREREGRKEEGWREKEGGRRRWREIRREGRMNRQWGWRERWKEG